MGSLSDLATMYDMPALVVDSSQYLYKNALESEGIFRLSPEATHMQEVKDRYVEMLGKEGTVPLETLTSDPNVVAHLLKDFLRKLPSPLFPETENENLISACRAKDFSEKIAIYSEVVGRLPVANRKTLVVIAFLAKEIVERTEANKMSYQALGVVFGPCLMRMEPARMIEMWDSRIVEEVFGNFGNVIKGCAEIVVLGQVFSDGSKSFSCGPALTAQVQFMGAAAGSAAGGGKVDMEVRISIVGEENCGKFDFYCACVVKKAVDDKVRGMMSGLELKPLSDVAMLDNGKRVLVQLNYIKDWHSAGCSQPVAQADIRGRYRGACKSCACPCYSSPPRPQPSNCLYCGHSPANHKGPCGEPDCNCDRFAFPLSTRAFACQACGCTPGQHHEASKPARRPPPVVPPRRPSLPPPPSGLPPPIAPAGGAVGRTESQQTVKPKPIVPSSLTTQSAAHLGRVGIAPPPLAMKAEVQDYEKILTSANVVVLCFNIADPASFSAIENKWIPALHEMKVTAPMILVGLRRELRDDPARRSSLVREESGVSFLQRFSSVYSYTEISTSQYKGFRTLANAGLSAFILDKQQKSGQPSRPVSIPSPMSPEKQAMLQNMMQQSASQSSVAGSAAEPARGDGTDAEKGKCLVM